MDRLADALKGLAGKSVEAVEAIIESIVGAALNFLKKTVGFVAEHTWTLFVFLAGLIGVWLMQKVKKRVEVNISFFHDLIKVMKKLTRLGEGSSC